MLIFFSSYRSSIFSPEAVTAEKGQNYSKKSLIPTQLSSKCLQYAENAKLLYVCDTNIYEI